MVSIKMVLDKNEFSTVSCSVCGKDITSCFNNETNKKVESVYLVCKDCKRKAESFYVYKNELGNIFPYKIYSDLEAAKIIDSAFPTNVIQYRLMFYKSITEQVNGEALSRALKYARVKCGNDMLSNQVEWARKIINENK